MSALPEYMIPIFATFAPVFSNPVWANAQLLLIGAILCRGRRTVAAALRVMGRAEEAHFVNYHRVLNRAVWSALNRRVTSGLSETAGSPSAGIA